MNTLRALSTIVAALLLGPGRTRGQNLAETDEATGGPPPGGKSEVTQWSFSASAYAYFVPDSREYVQPTFAADRGWLHLEARYNYENLETGSVWVGYNLGGGGKLVWELTPMLGAVFGETIGVAPGYQGSLSWWRLELYSEGEYVVDRDDASESYFYNWSELSFAPLVWLRLGLVTQRTKVYQTDLDTQRGVLIGFSVRRVSLTTYLFNPDESTPTFVLAVSVDF